MNEITRKFSARHVSRNTACMIIAALALVACGKQKAASAATTATVDACALVSPALLGKIAHNLGAGHKSKTPHPANMSTCVWSDRASHLPVLMLTVAPADPAGVAKGLSSGMANMGYRIVSVRGLGDEAAAAIQIPNPHFHTKAAVAILSVRVGQQQMGFSPMSITIKGPGSASFKRLKNLVADSVMRFKSASK